MSYLGGFGGFDMGKIGEAKGIVSGANIGADSQGFLKDTLGKVMSVADEGHPLGGGTAPQEGESASNVKDALAGLKSSQAAGSMKKVASVVASFYTGGAAAAAMNAASQIASKNNPGAGAIIGAASSFMGGAPSASSAGASAAAKGAGFASKYDSVMKYAKPAMEVVGAVKQGQAMRDAQGRGAAQGQGSLPAGGGGPGAFRYARPTIPGVR